MIHLVMAGDDNYMHLMAAAAVSCVVNTSAPICLHILSNNISEESKEKLSRCIASLGKGADISFIDINGSLPKELKADGYISVTMFARYFIPVLLPDTDKALYLDTDLIVRHDLTELWNTDVSGYPLAAVREKYMEPKYSRVYGITSPVFNTGVLLMNSAYWRETELHERVLKYSAETGYNDQVSLNTLLAGNFLRLNPTWNTSKGFFKDYYRFGCPKETIAELRPIIKDPAIVHATGKVKLWDRDYCYPFREEFFRYLAMTPWKDSTPKKRPFHSMVSGICKGAAVRLIDRVRE